MPRLPVVGSDDGTWGGLLNEYLSVDHAADGSHKSGSARIGSGLDAAKGSAGSADRVYYATDTGILYRDTGSIWSELARIETSLRLAQLGERDHGSLTGLATGDPHTQYQLRSEKGAASGYASLDSSSKVVQDPASATQTPTASKIPIANGSGKLAAGWVQEVIGLTDLTDVGVSGAAVGQTLVYNGTSWSNASLNETAAFSQPDTLIVTTGKHRFYASRNYTIVSVRASVGTAPTGADLLVDVNKNGVTIFTTQTNRPTITAGTNTALAAAINVADIASGDYLTIDIDQVGSSVAGSDLTVQIVLRPS